MPDLTILPDGTIQCIYSDALRLPELAATLGGEMRTTRASNVEPDGIGWGADLSPVAGPTLGPFSTRTEALAAEVSWLQENRL